MLQQALCCILEPKMWHSSLSRQLQIVSSHIEGNPLMLLHQGANTLDALVIASTVLLKFSRLILRTSEEYLTAYRVYILRTKLDVVKERETTPMDSRSMPRPTMLFNKH